MAESYWNEEQRRASELATQLLASGYKGQDDLNQRQATAFTMGKAEGAQAGFQQGAQQGTQQTVQEIAAAAQAQLAAQNASKNGKEAPITYEGAPLVEQQPPPQSTQPAPQAMAAQDTPMLFQPPGPQQYPMLPPDASQGTSATLDINRRVRQVAADANDQRARIQDSTDSHIQAQAAKAQVEGQIANAQQPLYDEKIRIDQDYAAGVANVNQQVQAAQADYMQKVSAYTDQIRAEAAVDPTKVWDNASTGTKVASLISIIGAGLGGADPFKQVDRLVQYSVMAHEQKLNSYSLGINAENQKFNQALHGLRFQQTQSAVYQASLHAVLADKALSVANQYASQSAQARLQEFAALQKDKEREALGLVEKNVNADLHVLATEQAKMVDQSIERVKANAAMVKANKPVAGQVGRRTRGWTGEVPDKYFKSVAELSGPTYTIVSNLQDVTKASGRLNLANPKDLVEFKRIIDSRQAPLIAAIREFSHSGSRIEQTEKEELFDKLAPTLSVYLKKKTLEGLDLAALQKELELTQEAVLGYTNDRIKAYNPDMEVDYDDPVLGPVAQRQMARAEGEAKTAAVNSQFDSLKATGGAVGAQ